MTLCKKVVGFLALLALGGVSAHASIVDTVRARANCRHGRCAFSFQLIGSETPEIGTLLEGLNLPRRDQNSKEAYAFLPAQDSDWKKFLVISNEFGMSYMPSWKTKDSLLLLQCVGKNHGDIGHFAQNCVLRTFLCPETAGSPNGVEFNPNGRELTVRVVDEQDAADLYALMNVPAESEGKDLIKRVSIQPARNQVDGFDLRCRESAAGEHACEASFRSPRVKSTRRYAGEEGIAVCAPRAR